MYRIIHGGFFFHTSKLYKRFKNVKVKRVSRENNSRVNNNKEVATYRVAKSCHIYFWNGKLRMTIQTTYFLYKKERKDKGNPRWIDYLTFKLIIELIKQG